MSAVDYHKLRGHTRDRIHWDPTSRGQHNSPLPATEYQAPSSRLCLFEFQGINTTMATADDGKPKYGDMRDYAGPNLFQPHQARKAIRDAHEGKIPPMLGYFAALPSVPVTRWLAPIGYDVVWIDAEHSACGVETMTSVRHSDAGSGSGC